MPDDVLGAAGTVGQVRAAPSTQARSSGKGKKESSEVQAGTVLVGMPSPPSDFGKASMYQDTPS